MLKTISAALLAVSVLAAPALAAESTKTTVNAPVVKTTQANTTQAKTTEAKATQGKIFAPITTRAKPAVLNANARMGHHRKYVRHHHRHGKMSVLKTAPKFSSKPAALTTKRG